MKVVIDENGDVIEGAASLMSVQQQTATVPDGGAIPDTPAASKVFQCDECLNTIEWFAGRATPVHRCGASSPS